MIDGNPERAERPGWERWGDTQLASRVGPTETDKKVAIVRRCRRDIEIGDHDRWAIVGGNESLA